MIATVTLNPAIDKTYTASGLIMGQVNRMKTVRNLAGGKGINVTKILRQYGYPVTALGFSGGYTGSFIENYLKEIKAVSAFTRVHEETRSSINVIAEDGYITEILEPGPEITKQEKERFLADYKLALADCRLVVLSGSVPRGLTEDIYETLIRLAGKQDKRVILDTSGEYLVNGVKGNPFMIKPNLRELEYLTGQKIAGTADVASAAKELAARGIAHVMVSLGEKGLIYASADFNEVLYASSPDVRMKNTIGCGDSVTASFCMSCLKQEDAELTLRKAVAISAACATTFEIGIIPMDLAEELLPEVKISTIFV